MLFDIVPASTMELGSRSKAKVSSTPSMAGGNNLIIIIVLTSNITVRRVCDDTVHVLVRRSVNAQLHNPFIGKH